MSRGSVPVLVPVLNRLGQKLKQLNQFPDFNNYLIFVLTRLKSEGGLLCSAVWGLLGPRGVAEAFGGWQRWMQELSPPVPGSGR